MAKLLLISADEVLAHAYCAHVSRAGFEIEHAATGHEGLTRARRGSPDLILLDLALPGMHGLDVLKMLRDVPWLVKVPVTLLVERTLSREALHECLLWGAGSYLEKDLCSLEDVVAHLRVVLPSTGHPLAS